MKRGFGKALYVFLCSLLGMILFLIFHRALVVIYYILLENNYQSFSLGMSGGNIQTLDFLTMLLALFLGGWYGVWLGLSWYSMVYEGEERPGLFHGFIPHHYRRAERAKRRAARSEGMVTKEVHIPVSSSENTDKINSLKTAMPWDLDDIDTEDMIKKPVRKKAVRKTTRKKKED